MPERIAEHKKDMIARLLAQGRDTKVIAALAGVSTGTVLRYSNSEDEDMTRRVEVYRTRLLKEQALFNFELMDMTPQVLEVYRAGLDPNRSWRERFECARHVQSSVFTPQPQSVNHQVEGTVKHEVNARVEAALITVAAKLKELEDAPAFTEWMRSVKTGPAALPGPATNISVKIEDKASEDSGE